MTQERDWARLARRALDLLIVTAVIVTVARLATPDARSIPAVMNLAPGDTLRVQGAAWSGANRHLVLVLRTTCPACNESAGTYRTLAAAMQRPGERFVVIGDEPIEQMREWLNTRQVTANVVLTTPRLRDLGFTVTPTLLIANRHGTVSDIIEGALSSDELAQLRSRLAGGSDAIVRARRIERIVPADMTRLRQEEPFLLLDVRARDEYTRNHAPDAVNIPHDELETRAPAELPRDRAIVIDCRRGRYARCEIAWEVLSDAGAHKLFILTDR